ncbi:DMT family transporter [uncultured Tateyamaria sp.]|uniref:DMT family transporter n=1 Tax=uncultured Tateyamaria sp. TaxID=455651 RepID=UPI00260D8170|nr:DMT family transporter [uncultured Tateyamaria sp.]
MTQDRPFLGIMLMLGFCVVAPMGDAFAKLLGGSIPLGQLLFVRFGIQVVLLIPLIWVTGRAWRIRGRVLWLTLLRTVLHIVGIGAMFTALKFLPLADAVAIAFVMPFIMMLLGKYVLNEEVGSRRLWACVVGFVGTLLVVQPSFAEVGWPALLPLAVAINFAFFMLVTRHIAKDTDPVGLQAVSGVMAMMIMGPILWLTQGADLPALQLVTLDISLPGDQWTSLFEMPLFQLIAIGVLGTLAHLLMTWSLRYAPSATLAPMQYLEIPVATIIGLAIFGDLPNGLAAIGICITVGAGLYIVFRERAIAQLEARTPAPV